MTALYRSVELGRFGSLTVEDAHELTGSMLLLRIRDDEDELLDRGDVEALRALCDEVLA